MFQIGDQVIYGIHGVCDIRDIEQQTVDKKNVDYLVLEPRSQTGARFLVPTHNKVAMGKLRKMLTREEMEQLILSREIREVCWIADESQRKQTYRELISSGDRVRLMAMVHTLYHHKTEQAAAGKKVHLCDENFLRDAEKLLISEVSAVMEMESDQAKQYIRSNLQK